MRRLVALSMFTAALMAAQAGSAQAQTVGPICLKPSTFNDTFVLIYNFHGPNHLVGSGRNLTSGGAVTTTAILNGNTAVVGIASPLPSSGAPHSAFFSANLSIATLSGPGRCESLNTGLACGTSAAFTMSAVQCPAGALVDEGDPRDR